MPGSRRIVSPYYGYTNYYFLPGYHYPRYRRSTGYEVDCNYYLNPASSFRRKVNWMNNPDYLECKRIYEDMRISGFGDQWLFRN